MPQSRSNNTRTIAWGQIGMLGLLLILLLGFSPGLNPWWVGVSFGLLVIYHLASHSLLDNQPYQTQLHAWLHLGCYLLLCAFLLWATTRPDEESLFWFVSLLPVVMAASHLSLAGTTLVAAAASLVYFLLLPEGFILAGDFWDEFPEFVLISVTYFFVGFLVQALSSKARSQLLRQQKLNRELLQQKTELTQTLEQLDSAEQQLRRRDRLAALGEMSAGIAHEIRNPLGIISSTAQLMMQRNDSNKNGTDELLGVIQEESTRLNRLITDFLTFGRDANPEMQLSSLASLTEKAVDGFKPLAEQARVSLKIQTLSDPQVMVDPGMLQQILLNLLFNALQACQSGGQIHVSISQKGNQALLQVTDNGCGITPELQEKIFNPFFTTRDKGTGLGLANAHKLTMVQGGDLSFTSTPGLGSTFSILLPLEVNNDASHPDC